ncbi:serine hydrolase domain-containing protein [Pseudarthrobacter niigatensis]|uniref:CubicO group peptidase (Beta-lactamase class C family) n=1 Tax=Pseudarthrobacter niigatensis TaxID=369935 RepID=A0AAJ1SVS8_9MICC|nr:serine hydrolase domain-containing protein [Pseudarthrobacter niigatensis]MDQ0144662.1 CubicO group peptidase (beta-lactamase class C family) [Pseudarthrobacter niigatensis]MDQ0265308.1 CubicO group peptidase (beta-lactamase class C family) [Pseudarthrobacter niigatensis]
MKIEKQADNPPVQGWVDDRFGKVVDAYLENYRQGDELGSSLHVTVAGNTVVDLWGGWTDDARMKPWTQDTLVCMMSVAKGISAIAIAVLVDRGQLDLDKPVANYWPEFGQNGKEIILLRWVLDHRAGLPALVDEPLWPGATFDREAMVKALERARPLWEPGTVAAYHVQTQGYILGELVRRVTGTPIGEFIRSEITDPLGADYWMGLPETEFSRTSDLLPNDRSRLIAARDAEAPDSLRVLALAQNPDWPWRKMVNSAEWRTAEIASASGHGNGRAVARIYAAMANGGTIDGVRIMKPDTVRRFAEMQHNMIEIVQERNYRQGLGLLLNSPDAVYMGPHDAAFGHHGIGGSIGFADPVEQVSFGYAINKMHEVGTNGPRARRLIDAVYASL